MINRCQVSHLIFLDDFDSRKKGALVFHGSFFYRFKTRLTQLPHFKILLGMIGLPLLKAVQPNKGSKYINRLHPFILFDNPDIIIYKLPILREFQTNLPISCTYQFICINHFIFCTYRSYIFKPNDMIRILSSVGIER